MKTNLYPLSVSWSILYYVSIVVLTKEKPESALSLDDEEVLEDLG